MPVCAWNKVNQCASCVPHLKPLGAEGNAQKKLLGGRDECPFLESGESYREERFYAEATLCFVQILSA